MIPEDEAEEKWCPFARVVKHVDAGSFNRTVANDDSAYIPIHAKCIASRCMMWRWEDSKSERGYCGLAT